MFDIAEESAAKKSSEITSVSDGEWRETVHPKCWFCGYLICYAARLGSGETSQCQVFRSGVALRNRWKWGSCEVWKFGLITWLLGYIKSSLGEPISKCNMFRDD
jgi:hypothetical protein